MREVRMRSRCTAFPLAPLPASISTTTPRSSFTAFHLVRDPLSPEFTEEDRSSDPLVPMLH
jgi:hypothetical protein